MVTRVTGHLRMIKLFQGVVIHPGSFVLMEPFGVSS